MRGGWIAIAALAALAGCAANASPVDTGQVVARSSDDRAERKIIASAVTAAVAAKDFAKLSALEADFRTTRARTPSGLWKLAEYHAALQDVLDEGLDRAEGCELEARSFLHEWRAVDPKNPAPAITEAALLNDQAWCFRGTGYAGSVVEEAWPKFRATVAEADAVLMQSKPQASIDPEFYAVAVDVARARGVTSAAFAALVDEATEREPYYHRTYFNAVWNYLPQWGGSWESVDAFARYAAERTGTSEKEGFYARIFWSLEECGCDTVSKAADWPTMRRAMRDVYDRYPVKWNGEYFAHLACAKGDGEEGRHYIRALHPEATGEGDFVALFANCDMVARHAARTRGAIG